MRPKTYSYLTDNNDENKIAKVARKYFIKWKLKFEDYENCPEENQFEKEINQLQRNKLDKDSLRENHKEFIRNSRLISKSRQRFNSKKHNVFTGEISKIVLSVKNDKGIQSIGSIERCTFGTNKEIIHKN